MEGKQGEKVAESGKKPSISEPPPGAQRPSGGGGQPPRTPGDPWSSFLGGGGPRGGGPGGKGPGGNEGGDKLIFMAVVGTIFLLGTFTYYEMSYTEITWRDFVNM